MKRFFILVAAVVLFSNVQAQSDNEDEPVLPAEAQECVLPTSPSAIADDASYSDLVAASLGPAFPLD